MDLTSYILAPLLFSVHSFFSLTLIKRFLPGERFHKSIFYLFCLANAFVSPLTIKLLGEHQVLAYVIISLVTLVEGLILFRGKKVVTFALSSGLMLHFFAIRSVTLAINSLLTDSTMLNIISSSDTLALNTLMAIGSHVVILIIFTSFVTPKAAKAIIANNTLFVFIAALMISIHVYFIYNSRIFMLEYSGAELAIQQIILPLVLLGLFYVMLIFMLRLVMLDTYQSVIDELEKKIDKNNMLSNAIFNYAESVLEFNVTEDKIVRAIITSKEVEELTDTPFSDFINKHICSITHPDDLHILERINTKTILRAHAKSTTELNFEYRSYKIIMIRDDVFGLNKDKYFWHQMRIIINEDEQSKAVVALLTIDEINEEKEKELALQMKSERDPLTGAYNKEAVRAKVSKHLDNGLGGTLFVFDLDNFKSINDNMGHSYGDAVLTEIYNDVVHWFRAHDIVGRFGGDEYVAFIPGDSPREVIIKIAERICSSASKTYTADDGTEISISTSIGIAIAPEHGDNYEELFNAADTALYKSKHKGKNTYTIYETE